MEGDIFFIDDTSKIVNATFASFFSDYSDKCQSRNGNGFFRYQKKIKRYRQKSKPIIYMVIEFVINIKCGFYWWMVVSLTL